MNKGFITEKNRIYLPGKNGDIIAEIAFEKTNKTTYDIYHTFVDESMRGQGIADELVQKAKEYIKGQNCSITASCPYAKKHLTDNSIIQKNS